MNIPPDQNPTGRRRPAVGIMCAANPNHMGRSEFTVCWSQSRSFKAMMMSAAPLALSPCDIVAPPRTSTVFSVCALPSGGAGRQTAEQEMVPSSFLIFEFCWNTRPVQSAVLLSLLKMKSLHLSFHFDATCFVAATQAKPQ